MVGKVLAIAGNAFRETIRQPVFVVVLGVAGAMLALSPAFSMFTLMEGIRLVQDMGLSTILLAGLLLAVLSASSVISEEIRGRTALMVVARPVGRGEFVLGKFLGIALAQVVAAYLLSILLVLTVRIGVPEAAYSEIDTIAIWSEVGALVLAIGVAAGVNYFFDKPFPSALVFAALVLFSALFFVLAFFDKSFHLAPFLSAMDTDTIRACVALVPQVLILTAVAVAVATRVSLVMSVVLCALVFVAGMLSDYLFSGVAATMLWGRIVYTVLPNFQVFWMGDALSAETTIPWSYVGAAVGYAALYTTGLLFLGMMLFERREIQ